MLMGNLIILLVSITKVHSSFSSQSCILESEQEQVNHVNTTHLSPFVDLTIQVITTTMMMMIAITTTAMTPINHAGKPASVMKNIKLTEI